MYRRIRLSEDASNPTWFVDDVRMLMTTFGRLKGISGSPVMLLTRSIHTFTLGHPIAVVALDLDGVVVSASVMQPGRMLDFRTRRWVVETSPGGHLPRVGTRIIASTMPEQCQAH
ncbi:MAG: hypothetical protein BMS9Abin12_1198 [Acidimicrobiia bacterium]|nr:MAG: hypothetical protein BMS9Abin12_1198 [Acidimicrobiia bacterium]